jgi:hypothetical protein
VEVPAPAALGPAAAGRQQGEQEVQQEEQGACTARDDGASPCVGATPFGGGNSRGGRA